MAKDPLPPEVQRLIDLHKNRRKNLVVTVTEEVEEEDEYFIVHETDIPLLLAEEKDTNEKDVEYFVIRTEGFEPVQKPSPEETTPEKKTSKVSEEEVKTEPIPEEESKPLKPKTSGAPSIEDLEVQGYTPSASDDILSKNVLRETDFGRVPSKGPWFAREEDEDEGHEEVSEETEEKEKGKVLVPKKVSTGEETSFETVSSNGSVEEESVRSWVSGISSHGKQSDLKANHQPKAVPGPRTGKEEEGQEKEVCFERKPEAKEEPKEKWSTEIIPRESVFGQIQQKQPVSNESSSETEQEDEEEIQLPVAEIGVHTLKSGEPGSVEFFEQPLKPFKMSQRIQGRKSLREEEKRKYTQEKRPLERKEKTSDKVTERQKLPPKQEQMVVRPKTRTAIVRPTAFFEREERDQQQQEEVFSSEESVGPPEKFIGMKNVLIPLEKKDLPSSPRVMRRPYYLISHSSQWIPHPFRVRAEVEEEDAIEYQPSSQPMRFATQTIGPIHESPVLASHTFSGFSTQTFRPIESPPQSLRHQTFSEETDHFIDTCSGMDLAHGFNGLCIESQTEQQYVPQEQFASQEYYQDRYGNLYPELPSSQMIPPEEELAFEQDEAVGYDFVKLQMLNANEEKIEVVKTDERKRQTTSDRGRSKSSRHSSFSRTKGKAARSSGRKSPAKKKSSKSRSTSNRSSSRSTTRSRRSTPRKKNTRRRTGRRRGSTGVRRRSSRSTSRKKSSTAKRRSFSRSTSRNKKSSRRRSSSRR